MALQTEELQIAKGMEWGAALLREMRKMRVKVRETGAESYGGRHDDMVFAMALAVWGRGSLRWGICVGGRG